MRRIPLFLVIILLSLILGTVSCSPKKQASAVTAAPDQWDWPLSSPEAQGMDSAQLVAMLEKIREQYLKIHSIQITRNGVLVMDAYTPPFKEGDHHNIRSCTKSILSILIGIAVDQGYIESLDQKVLDFFPDREVENLSEEKGRLTLRHLLTMSTGLESRDSYLYRWAGLVRMRNTNDWVGYILDLPITAEPGSRFDYSNMASHLLSAIITETTGKSAFSYGREYLFGPLGITDIEWPSDMMEHNISRAEMSIKPPERVEISVGWSEIHVKARDLAKIGQLVLNGGQWEGRQIVSTDYLKAATSSQIQIENQQSSYGFQWWIYEPGLFTALGYGGQYLIVFPEESLVVVFTSNLSLSDIHEPYVLFSTFIRPALQSGEPLPENKEALEALEKLIR